MSDEIFFDGHRYISAGEASSVSDLTRDYVARLCRDGKLRGKRVGKNWYVSDSSLKNFLVEQEHAKAIRRESLSESRARQYSASTRVMPVAPREELSRPAVLPAPAASPAFSPALDLTKRASQTHSAIHKRVFTHAERAARMAPAALANPIGTTDAMLRGAAHGLLHVPTHAISPFAEFVQKFVALVVACTMTFGTYALVDPEYGRYALSSMHSGIDALVDRYREATAGGAGALVRSVGDSMYFAAENPGAALAQASSAGANSFARTFQGLARAVNSGIDTLIYSIAFPSSLTRSNAVTPGSSVAIEIAPYTTAKNAPTTPSTSIASSASTPSTVVERIVERVETERIVEAAGGISEEYLAAKLSALETTLTGRLLGSTQGGGNTTIMNNYQMLAQAQNIDQLGSVAITNSTFTGGSISGATITGGSVTATAFDGVLGIDTGGTGTSTAPAYGQVLLGNASGTYDLVSTSSLGIVGGGGAGTPGGSDSQIQFNDNGSFAGSSSFTFSSTTELFSVTNASTTNASTTRLFAQYASTTQATSTSLFSVLGRFTSAIIDSLSATVATIANLTATTFTATNASTTQLSNVGTAYFGGTATTTIDSTGAITVTSTGANTFPYASSTALTTSNLFASSASSTSLILSGIQNGLLSTDADGDVVATTTPTALSFYATSNTASRFPYASTTALTVSGTGFVGLLNITDPTTATSTLISLSGRGLLAASSTVGNLFLGLDAGSGYSWGEGNTAVGYQAFKNATSSGGSSNTTNNTAFGYQALMGSASGETISGYENTAFGHQALSNFISGYQNTAVGKGALANATSSSSNVAVGYSALSGNSSDFSGFSNIAVGNSSLAAMSTGNKNIAVGSNAGGKITTGVGNIAIGDNAMYEGLFGAGHTTGSDAIVIGRAAGALNITQSYSADGFVGIGYGALGSIRTGAHHNVALGYQAGSSVTTGYSNVLVGPSITAGNLTSGSGNIGIGTNVFFASATGNRQLNIGNLIFGSLPATTTAFQLPTSGTVGIGTTSPLARFGIALNSGSTLTKAFEISSSTASATSTLFLVTNTGNVGIGSSTPFYKLAVSGIGAFDDYVRSSYFLATSTTASTFPYASTTALTATTGYFTNLLSFGSSTIGSGSQTEGLTISGGATTTGNTYFAGRVAIGAPPVSTYPFAVTSSGFPSQIALFHTTESGGSAQSRLRLTTGTGNLSDFVLYDSNYNDNASYAGFAELRNNTTAGGLMLTSSGTSGAIRFLTGGSSVSANTRMVVASTGNVGIGSSTPFYKLAVSGIGAFDDYVRSSYFVATSTTASTFPYASTTALTVSGTSYITGGRMDFSAAAATTTIINNNAYAWTIATSSTGRPLLQIDTTSGAEQLVLGWGSSGNVTVDSGINFGIGSSTPFYTLSVSGIGAFDNYVRASYFVATSTTASVFRQIDLTDPTTSTSTILTLSGRSLLNASSTSLGSIFLGLDAGARMTTGLQNSALGHRALATVTTGGANTALGYAALEDLLNGTNNTAAGASALADNTSGDDNTAFGRQALLSNTTGSGSTAVGSRALGNTVSVTGPRNTAIGATALGTSVGAYNVAVGYQAGSAITSGIANILIGTSNTASNLSTGSRNIGIGTDIFFASGTANNQLNIGGLIFGTLPATTTAFQLPTSGTVGIGTTSATSKFGIALNSGDTLLKAFEISSSTASATSTLFVVANTGNVGIGTSTPSKSLSVFSSAASVASFNSSDASGPFIDFLENNVLNWQMGVDGGCATNGFFIYSGGAGCAFNISTAGNVGIGTTTPSGKLHVWSSSSVNPVIETTGTGSYTFLSTKNDSAVYTEIGTYGSAFGSTLYGITRNNLGLVGYSGTNALVVGTSGSAPLVFGTGGNERARIDTSGNVGIGTTTPVSGVHLVSSVPYLTADDSTGTTGFVALGGSDAVGQLMFDSAGSFRISSQAYASRGTNAGETARLTVVGSTGYVGIGTTTPWAKLSVTATDNVSVPQFVVASSTKINFIVRADGKTGIGTTTIDKTLTVGDIDNNGAIRAISSNSWFIASLPSAPTSDRISIYPSGTNQTIWVGSGDLLIANGDLSPSTDNDQDLGSTSARWDCVYYDATVLGTCASDARLKGNIADFTLEGSALESLVGLRPRTFTYNDNPSQSINYGFIAQEVEEVAPDLVATSTDGYLAVRYGYLPYLTIQAIKELNLKVSDLASTTPTAANESFVTSFFDSAFVRLVAWFADATNGIGDFFANRVRTKALCVGDESGAETCVSKAQLDALLAGASASQSGGGEGEEETPEEPAPEEPPADTIAPVISVIGASPATISIGDTYSDLGATVSDLGSPNIGIEARVDGGEWGEIGTLYIDTAEAGTHTVEYRATDAAGNIGTAERVVEVVDPNAAPEEGGEETQATE